MRSVIYNDLARYGLPFVTRYDPDYERLAAGIRAQFPVPDDAIEGAAVVLNQSGRDVVAMTVVWTYWPAVGAPQKRAFESDSVSTAVFDATGARHSAFAAGSKRLLTSQGIFGNNSDATSEPSPRGTVGPGWVFRHTARPTGIEDAPSAEVQLDSVFFDDGLCVGPDERGTFEGVKAALAEQRALVERMLTTLRAGGTAADVFTILHPLTRQPVPPPPPRTGLAPPSLRLHWFAKSVMRRLAGSDEPALRAWLEQIAAQPMLKLRRG